MFSSARRQIFFHEKFLGFAEKPCQTVAVVVRCGSEVIQGRAGMPPPAGQAPQALRGTVTPGKVRNFMKKFSEH